MTDKCDNYVLNADKNSRNHSINRKNYFQLPIAGQCVTNPVAFNKKVYSVIKSGGSGGVPEDFNLLTISDTKEIKL
jgi:hypothetical protein